MRNIFFTVCFMVVLSLLSTTVYSCPTNPPAEAPDDTLNAPPEVIKIDKNESKKYNMTLDLILKRQILIIKPEGKIQFIHKGSIVKNDSMINEVVEKKVLPFLSDDGSSPVFCSN